MSARSVFAAIGLSSLLLAGCAGKPTGPQVASSKRVRCEHATGSLMCGNGDDQNVVGPGDLTDSSPRANATQSELSTGQR